jgi:hypothetical protein
MTVGVLVGGMGVDVKVSVGWAGVGAGVSVEKAVGEATSVVAAGLGTSTGALEGSVQAVSRKVRANEIARKFFIADYGYRII